jgi:hypothetical protein
LAVGGAASPTTQLYDPATGLWTFGASNNLIRFGAATTLLKDRKELVARETYSAYSA